MKKIRTSLVIIGAGPAGLGAAIYAARSALDFIVIEKFVPGGQITVTEYIENYPGFKNEISGYELMSNIIEHCKKYNVKIEENLQIEKIKILQPSFFKSSKISGSSPLKNRFICSGADIEIEADSVIIATGASPQRLFVEGENEFIGNGISYCATWDGALYRDKEVILIGGGNTAIQEALFLVKFAKTVYVVHRRNQLRAVKSLQIRAFNEPKIKFIWDSVVERFLGKERLEAVQIKNVKTNAVKIKKIDGVFEYIGVLPNSSFVKDILDTDETGFIITNSRMETSVKGIYAAGDVRNTELRQVITAVSDGAVAATFADKYLNDLI